MKAWEEYAYVVDGKVQNVGVYQINSAGYTVANSVAKEIYGPEAIAVNVTQYPVFIGDDYIEGIFYHDGREILRTPTDEERIINLYGIVDDLAVALLEG